MLEPLIIRSATLEDAATLRELGETTFRATFTGTTSDENLESYMVEAYAYEKFVQEINDPMAIFFIAEMNGKAIAYMKLSSGHPPDCVSDKTAMEIERLYVQEEFIAQKIGAQLMQKALTVAMEKGHQTIFLGVWEHNERAKAFYHKWGFKRVGEHVFQMGDDPQIDWWMERDMGKDNS